MSAVLPSPPPKKLAVLVSGGGRSLENICERIERRALTGCRISVVIASKYTAGAIEKAERFGIPTRVLRFKDFARSTERFSDAISAALDEFGVDLVVLAGWMHFYFIPSRYEGKVINIHPSLIPAFCGKGYFGHHVHEAVVRSFMVSKLIIPLLVSSLLKSNLLLYTAFPFLSVHTHVWLLSSQINFGAKITGCTVHLADNKYDHGPIILQYAVAVHDTDTADVLAARVFESEKDALPQAIQLFIDGKLSVQGRKVHIRLESASTNV